MFYSILIAPGAPAGASMSCRFAGSRLARLLIRFCSGVV